MAMAHPIFGFACMAEEREHRNRITTKLGINTIESWVGRDTQNIFQACIGGRCSRPHWQRNTVSHSQQS